jgi:hypothetical protein
MTLSIDIQHNSIEGHYAEFRYDAEFRYAECCDYLNVMLSVVIVNVVMLSVVAPTSTVKNNSLKSILFI